MTLWARPTMPPARILDRLPLKTISLPSGLPKLRFRILMPSAQPIRPTLSAEATSTVQFTLRMAFPLPLML